MLRVVADGPARDDLAAELDEIVREGARRMLAAALEAEVQAYLVAFADGSAWTGVGWWCATGMPGRGW